MPRPATGQIIEDNRGRSTTFGVRFRAYGNREYVSLGTAEEGWTREKAQPELENVLADVRRGIWKPPEPHPAPTVEQDPLFHEFASHWFETTKGEWSENTRLDYQWQLSHHLLPFFKKHRLSQITIAEVDRYRAAKVTESARRAKALADWRKRVDQAKDAAKRRELARQRPPRPLSAVSINKTITRLGQILELAVEYPEYVITTNPARGKRRRLKASKPTPVWLDSAEQIEALLDAAGELDRKAKSNGQLPRRAILSTLVFAGLRIGELTALRWQDVNLADGRITVQASKTDAGMRRIDLLPVLRDELSALKARRGADAGERVFPTQAGGAMNASNVRTRILASAVKLASERLEEAGETPLPAKLTPHKLRHTFASLLVALGVDAGAAMDQLGHTDPTFTLRVYRHGMRRDPEAKARLRKLVGAAEWAAMGSSATFEGQAAVSESNVHPAKTPSEQAVPPTRPASLELATSRSGGERSIH
jgi:integrase